jgi:hypothetical protein
MSIFLLIPGIISLILVRRGRVETAFLSVYLPSLLLLPEDYGVKIPHLPGLSTAQFALIPIGVAALVRHLKSRSLRFMDLLVALFFICFAITEILLEPVMNDGIFRTLGEFVSVVLAYVAGRRLIEPDLRLATVRRIVILFLLTAPICVHQWMGRNLYGNIGSKVFRLPMVDYEEDTRNGHGKAGGAFLSSEIVGIALGMTFALNAWLVFLNKKRKDVNLGKLFSRLETYRLPELLLLLCLFLTQERAPQMALAAVLLILQIPKFKHTKLVTGLVALVLIVAAVGAQQYLRKYEDIPDWDYGSVSEQARSVFYRFQMNKLYAPIADRGGWLGWGGSGVPAAEGVGRSIDNEFLRVHLVQGLLGYILFLLITAESVRTAIARMWSLEALEDRVFAASVLAALVCLWSTLYTVYMGQQLPEFAFLLIGWGQSIAAGKTSTAPIAGVEAYPKFAFRRVFR